MLQRNKVALLLVVIFALASFSAAQAISTTVQANQSQNVPPSQSQSAPAPAGQQQSSPAPSGQQSTTPQQQNAPAPQQPATVPPQDAPNQPGNTVQVPNQQQGQGAQVERQGDEGFVIKTTVQEVTLHATVIDDKHRLVNSLTKNDFQVFENGQLQQI